MHLGLYFSWRLAVAGDNKLICLSVLSEDFPSIFLGLVEMYFVFLRILAIETSYASIWDLSWLDANNIIIIMSEIGRAHV